jgi:hypothetical protein
MNADRDDEDALVRCLCSGELMPADKAWRLGCDQPGGCPELRDAQDWE